MTFREIIAWIGFLLAASVMAAFITMAVHYGVRG